MELSHKKEPDYKSALEWSIKAADLGNSKACYIAGCFLCEGIICEDDIEKGTEYLKKAVEAGVPGAEEALYLFHPSGEKEYSVEIACINGDKVDILWRYTVDGSSEVHEYFEPELLSLNIDD